MGKWEYLCIPAFLILLVIPLSADAKSFYMYVEDMPKHWEPQFGNVLYEATKYWEKQIPGTKFYVVNFVDDADFVVQWASEYQGTKIGYHTTNTVNDYGKPFIAITLGYMDGPEVKWQDRKFHLIDAEYAKLITIHELGHAIGLGHSDDPNDIMYPTMFYYDNLLTDTKSIVIPKQESESEYKDRASFTQSTYKTKIDKLKSGIETAENSLSGLEYESQDAQKKIEQAWKIRWSALEKLDQAKVKLEIGVNEIDKQNFRTAIINFKGIDADSESIGDHLRWISSAIEGAEKIESEYQSQKESKPSPKEEEKFCFLFWCW